MLTVLLISPADALDVSDSGHPSLEILHAHDVEMALEKLGRNRRIDAVVLSGWSALTASEIAAEIREDNPSPPPLFAIGEGPEGVRSLPEGSLAAALDTLARELTAES